MMRRALAATLLVAGLLTVGPLPVQAGPVFVTRNGSAFDLGGRPFRFGGTNNYYLHYKSQSMVDDVLNDAAAMNLKVIRAWSSLECGGDRPNSAGGCSQGTDLWMQRWSNATGGPVYNTGPGGLSKLDYLLAKANQLGIKLILPLVNNWPDFGGMDQYVTWYGLPFHDQFYTDTRIRAAYRSWVATLVNRYRDDPAIFAWELANEPRCINASLPTSGTCTQQTILDWAAEMSAYVKSLDGNHMVSVGDEGFLDWNRPGDWPYNAADGVDHEALTSLPNVDFGTYHAYPDHWGRPVSWVTQWIVDHQAAAAGYGKPVILEEFGLRDQGQRDAAYTAWTEAVRTGGGDGWNVWILTGIQDDGQLYPDYDGFRVTYPSATATGLAARAAEIGGGGDTTPPTRPGTPAASDIGPNGATLSWAPSVDTGGSGLAGYHVYHEPDVLVGSPVANSFALTGLAPSTRYSFYVVARDGAGLVSPPSAAVTFTTSGGGGASCRVDYAVADQWPGGFTGTVTFTSTVAVNGWTLRFAFPAGQQVRHGWSATWSQAGADVTAVAMSWNTVIPPGSPVQIGFNGSWTGSNPKPIAFTLNNVGCTADP